MHIVTHIFAEDADEDGQWIPDGAQPEDLVQEMLPRHSHSFGGSFSAGSTPIFASKYALFSIFHDLQEHHLLASRFCKFPQSFPQKFFLKFFRRTTLQNLKNFGNCQKLWIFLPNLLHDFEKSCRF